MAEFSKDELLEIIGIQQKTSQQLEAIVGALANCAERQQRIIKAVENGLGDKIVQSLEKSCTNCKSSVSSMARDVMWIKILLGLTGLTVTIVTVIFKVLHH